MRAQHNFEQTYTVDGKRVRGGMSFDGAGHHRGVFCTPGGSIVTKEDWPRFAHDDYDRAASSRGPAKDAVTREGMAKALAFLGRKGWSTADLERFQELLPVIVAEDEDEDAARELRRRDIEEVLTKLQKFAIERLPSEDHEAFNTLCQELLGAGPLYDNGNGPATYSRGSAADSMRRVVPGLRRDFAALADNSGSFASVPARPSPAAHHGGLALDEKAVNEMDKIAPGLARLRNAASWG